MARYGSFAHLAFDAQRSASSRPHTSSLTRRKTPYSSETADSWRLLNGRLCFLSASISAARQRPSVRISDCRFRPMRAPTYRFRACPLRMRTGLGRGEAPASSSSSASGVCQPSVGMLEVVQRKSGADAGWRSHCSVGVAQSCWGRWVCASGDGGGARRAGSARLVGCRCGPGAVSGGLGGQVVFVELEQVVCRGDQPPFRACGGSTSPLELADAPVVLGLSEHGLDHRLAFSVSPPPSSPARTVRMNA